MILSYLWRVGKNSFCTVRYRCASCPGCMRHLSRSSRKIVRIKFFCCFFADCFGKFCTAAPPFFAVKKGKRRTVRFYIPQNFEIFCSAKKYSIPAGYLSSLRRGMRFYPAQAPSAAWEAIRKSSRSKAAKQDESPADEKPAPGSSRKQNRTHNGCRKICILIIPAARSAFFGAENNAAADPRQKPRTVYNIPYRRHNCQSCRSSRPLILPEHRHINNSVNTGNQGAAKGRSKIFEIERFDFSLRKSIGFLIVFSLQFLS